MHKSKQSGQTIILVSILLTVIFLTITLGLSRPIVDEIKISSGLLQSKQSFFLAEAGAEDMVYRILNSLNASANSSLSIDGNTASVTVTDTEDGKRIESQGDVKSALRTVAVNLIPGTGISFPYGIHIGSGGLNFTGMASLITINGNVFSNGQITSDSTLVKSKIIGDVISAGPTGLIDNIYVGSAAKPASAYAHNINRANIYKDAFYGCTTCITGSTVFGTSTPNSPDQEPTLAPIDDATLDQWESDIEALGIINVSCPGGTYTVPSTASFGPGRLNCNLVINAGSVVFLNGPVWVNGNVTISGSLSVNSYPSLYNKSVLLIADNPSNRTTKSKINIVSAAVLHGYGTQGRIVLVSRNTSAEDGGNEIAISSTGAVGGEFSLYAPHGKINLSSVGIFSVDGISSYEMVMSGSFQIYYESGIQNPLFTLGPEGGFVIGTWMEVE
jgi:hypothetical protein